MKTIDFLCVIPARGGSKTIKKKNLFPLLGKKLIDYTIEACIEAKVDFLVSTEDIEIYDHITQYNSHLDYKRPKEFAEDTSHRNQVIYDLLNHFENKNIQINNIVYLQPTSPLRKHFHISDAINLFKKSSKDALVSVNECLEHPYECLTRLKDGTIEAIYDYQTIGMRQGYDKEYYFDNGAIYIFSTKSFLENKAFYQIDNVELYIMKKPFSFDVNDLEDMYIVESILNNRSTAIYD